MPFGCVASCSNGTMGSKWDFSSAVSCSPLLRRDSCFSTSLVIWLRSGSNGRKRSLWWSKARSRFAAVTELIWRRTRFRSVRTGSSTKDLLLIYIVKVDLWEHTFSGRAFALILLLISTSLGLNLIAFWIESTLCHGTFGTF